jgi:hypothetical protein
MPRRKPKNRGGRPCRYTPLVVTTLMAALARGESLEKAADAAGIGATTLYRWLALSRAGDARSARLAEAVDAVHGGSVNAQMTDQFLSKAARRGIWGLGDGIPFRSA